MEHLLFKIICFKPTKTNYETTYVRRASHCNYASQVVKLFQRIPTMTQQKNLLKIFNRILKYTYSMNNLCNIRSENLKFFTRVLIHYIPMHCVAEKINFAEFYGTVNESLFFKSFNA